MDIMKIIGNAQEIMLLDVKLSQFVFRTCPWIHDDWEPEQIGWIFILNKEDLKAARSLCVVPHCDSINDNEYMMSMTIDLEMFDTWEGQGIYDDASGYYNVVGIIGQEYGFTIFIEASLVQQLPKFKKNYLIYKDQS